MSMTGESGGQLDMGKVIQDLFAVLGRNFVTFLVLAIVLVGLPGLLSGYLQMQPHPGQLFQWPALLGSLVVALGGLILQGTVIYGTVTDLNGNRATLGQSVSIGLHSFLPILAIGIIEFIAVFLGCILLLVPGIMIAVAWCACIPAYVAERPGIMETFARSAELTRGNRWRIFALFLLFIVAVIVVEAVLGVFGSATRIAAGEGLSALQALIVRPLISVATGLLGATGGAVLYVELRRVRDGVGPAGLAAIFD